MTRRPAALLLAAGSLAACGGGDDDQAATPAAASGPPDAQVVEVLGTDALAFEPAAVTARTGTLTITLGNGGGVPHNLVFADRALPAIGTVGEGEQKSATYTFTSTGTYDFTCTFHPGMDGRVQVG